LIALLGVGQSVPGPGCRRRLETAPHDDEAQTTPAPMLTKTVLDALD